jgi:hypothetical protein
MVGTTILIIIPRKKQVIINNSIGVILSEKGKIQKPEWMAFYQYTQSSCQLIFVMNYGK